MHSQVLFLFPSLSPKIDDGIIREQSPGLSLSWVQGPSLAAERGGLEPEEPVGPPSAAGLTE